MYVHENNPSNSQRLSNQEDSPIWFLDPPGIACRTLFAVSKQVCKVELVRACIESPWMLWFNKLSAASHNSDSQPDRKELRKSIRPWACWGLLLRSIYCDPPMRRTRSPNTSSGIWMAVSKWLNEWMSNRMNNTATKNSILGNFTNSIIIIKINKTTTTARTNTTVALNYGLLAHLVIVFIVGPRHGVSTHHRLKQEESIKETDR